MRASRAASRRERLLFPGARKRLGAADERVAQLGEQIVQVPDRVGDGVSSTLQLGEARVVRFERGGGRGAPRARRLGVHRREQRRARRRDVRIARLEEQTAKQARRAQRREPEVVCFVFVHSVGTRRRRRLVVSRLRAFRHLGDGARERADRAQRRDELGGGRRAVEHARQVPLGVPGVFRAVAPPQRRRQRFQAPAGVRLCCLGELAHRAQPLANLASVRQRVRDPGPAEPRAARGERVGAQEPHQAAPVRVLGGAEQLELPDDVRGEPHRGPPVARAGKGRERGVLANQTRHAVQSKLAQPVKRRRHRARRLTAHGRSVVFSHSFAIHSERLFFPFVPKSFSSVIVRPRLAVPLQRLLRVARVGVPAGGGDALDARAFPLAEHGGDESARRRGHGLDQQHLRGGEL